MCVCACVCGPAHVCVCVRMWSCTCVCVRMCTCACMLMCVYACSCGPVHMCMGVGVCMFVSVCGQIRRNKFFCCCVFYRNGCSLLLASHHHICFVHKILISVLLLFLSRRERSHTRLWERRKRKPDAPLCVPLDNRLDAASTPPSLPKPHH